MLHVGTQLEFHNNHSVIKTENSSEYSTQQKTPTFTKKFSKSTKINPLNLENKINKYPTNKSINENQCILDFSKPLKSTKKDPVKTYKQTKVNPMLLDLSKPITKQNSVRTNNLINEETTDNPFKQSKSKVIENPQGKQEPNKKTESYTNLTSD